MKHLRKIICAALCVSALYSCSVDINVISGSDEPAEAVRESEEVTDAEEFTEAETTQMTEEVAEEEPFTEAETLPSTESSSLLSSPEDIGLYDADGLGQNYVFTYDGEVYYALCEPDNWHITDSYKIQDEYDILTICQALNSVHLVPGADGTSFRTAEDMAYEWVQHNIAYQLLPDDSPWKESAKDVDLDSKDQGKSAYQMLIERLQ